MAAVKSFRPSEIVVAAIDNNGGGRGMSHRLSQIADRYLEMLRRAPLPKMSEAEINAVRDALNGALPEPAEMIRGFAALEVEDALLDGLADKWGIDGSALVSKLHGLSYAQEVRLIEEIEKTIGQA